MIGIFDGLSVNAYQPEIDMRLLKGQPAVTQGARFSFHNRGRLATRNCCPTSVAALCSAFFVFSSGGLSSP